MSKKYEFPKSMNKVKTHYCGGCGHGIVHKLIAQVIDEMNIQNEVLLGAPVGCAVYAYNYINVVLEQYEDEVPDNALLLAEAIYYDYLTDVKRSENVQAFRDIQQNLITYEYLASDRLNKQISNVTNFFLEKTKAEEAAIAQENAEKVAIASANAAANIAAEATAKATTDAITAANDEIIKRFENISQEQLKQNRELQESQQEILGNMLSEIHDNNKESSNAMKECA